MGKDVNAYTMASIVLAIIPIVILVVGFLFCFVVSGGETSDNDRGAVWWVFVVLLWILIPLTLIMNVLSIIFGIKGLERENVFLGWLGILIISLELFVCLMIFCYYKFK